MPYATSTRTSRPAKPFPQPQPARPGYSVRIRTTASASHPAAHPPPAKPHGSIRWSSLRIRWPAGSTSPRKSPRWADRPCRWWRRTCWLKCPGRSSNGWNCRPAATSCALRSPTRTASRSRARPASRWTERSLSELRKQRLVHKPPREFFHREVFLRVAVEQRVSRQNPHQDFHRFAALAFDAEPRQRSHRRHVHLGALFPPPALFFPHDQAHALFRDLQLGRLRSKRLRVLIDADLHRIMHLRQRLRQLLEHVRFPLPPLALFGDAHVEPL